VIVAGVAKTKRSAQYADTRQPHDGLIKYAFSNRDHAEGLLKAILPPAIVALVDWGSLKLEKDSFIDAHLRRRYADLLLAAHIAGRRGLFYVLVEHKREVDALAVVQVGRYPRLSNTFHLKMPDARAA
jgi:predicted transposase YdaD